MLEDILQKWNGFEVSAMDIYTDIFKLKDSFIMSSTEEYGEFKTTPLAYYKNPNTKRGRNKIMFEDTFEHNLIKLQTVPDLAYMNGLTYFGSKRTLAAASKMYALIFDLDGVTDIKLNNFLSGAVVGKAYPVPNYITLSGHGVHLYYLFEYPVKLYPNIKKQLKSLKHALTRNMWNGNTSTIKNPQYQGINQAFRIVGSKTKIPGVTVRAFALNQHPFTINQLNEFVPEDKRIDDTKLYEDTELSQQKAKDLYPEWWERVVVRKEPKKTWTNKHDLYHWWIKQVEKRASYGHRYFCILCLAIYSVKCGIPRKQLEEDAISLIPFLNSIRTEEPFTIEDVNSALRSFDESYKTFPISSIEALSGIPIEKNKRNFRQQEVHMKIISSTRDILYPNQTWINREGAPTKQALVEEWQHNNPLGKKTQCKRDLNIDKNTVSKWWVAKPNNK